MRSTFKVDILSTLAKICLIFRILLRSNRILEVLTHTTAWEQIWGGDETMNLVSIYLAQLH